MSAATRVALVCAVVAGLGAITSAQPAVTLALLLSAPFPVEISAAPAGGHVAWVQNDAGARNVWIAGPPSYDARRITAFAGDDGQEITELAWSSDAGTVYFTRGQGPNRQGESPNPAHLADGVEQAVWAIGTDGGVPRRLGPGRGATPRPGGRQVAWVNRGQVWAVTLEGDQKPAQLFTIRGSASNLTWSPDGRALAFVSGRGTHSFVGVFTAEDRATRYLDPSLDRDGSPAWSPDSARIAFVRTPGGRRPRMFSPRREAEPWSIRIADATTGKGREVWKADRGLGSVPQAVRAANQLLWGAGDRLVFPWERDGWLHLYSVPAAGGRADLLTPGDFEVEDVVLSPGGTRVIYSSNQGDIDRRHLWSVDVGGGARPAPVTTGNGIEWSPAVASTGTAIALFRSDARTPAHVAVIIGEQPPRALNPAPATFPAAQLVEPQPVTVTAADGMQVHAQLFVPRDLNAGERRPAVVFFHGGSRRQMLLGWHYLSYYHHAYALNQYLASRGFLVLSVNYRSGIGYGLEFREAVNYGATGASEFNDVIGAGLYLKSRPDVDPARIGLWGGSYGGYLTAMGLSRASDLFAAGVDFHGVHDWNQGIRTFVPDYTPLEDPEFSRRAFEASPLASVATWRSPVLLIHGDDDRNVSFIESINLLEQLRARGVEVEHLVFPDEVHGFLRHESWLRAYEASAEFLERRLKATSP